MLHQTPLPSGHFISSASQPFQFSQIPHDFFNQSENNPSFYPYYIPQQYPSFDCPKLDGQPTVSPFIPEKQAIPPKPPKTFKSPEEEKKSRARRDRNNKAAQPIISRNYRGDIDMSVIDKFVPLLGNMEEEGQIAPIIDHPDSTFIFVKYNNIYSKLV
uniref:Uncharacterized protein n=1 Tax=Panagrolaimus sp. ES5 TaxID=591445 RepID=A0AC34FFX3_9BILA